MHEPAGHCLIRSPVGELLVQWSEVGLSRIQFNGTPDPAIRPQPAPFDVERQLSAYFAGDLRQFELPLDPQGTPFQLQVWTELRMIPYGVTMTYGELAYALGKPTASRAVGGANNRNLLPVVIPCHRVIGADGRLTGFAGGLETKQQLLDLERRALARPTR